MGVRCTVISLFKQGNNCCPLTSEHNRENYYTFFIGSIKSIILLVHKLFFPIENWFGLFFLDLKFFFEGKRAGPHLGRNNTWSCKIQSSPSLQCHLWRKVRGKFYQCTIFLRTLATIQTWLKGSRWSLCVDLRLERTKKLFLHWNRNRIVSQLLSTHLPSILFNYCIVSLSRIIRKRASFAIECVVKQSDGGTNLRWLIVVKNNKT